MRKYYEVPKSILLLIAGIVWMCAGFNVARLGIMSYIACEFRWFYPLLSVVIFCAFGAMFFRITQKHTKRIKAYKEDYRPFWNFFDIKSYIIMVIMMGGGIALRASGIVPEWCIAFFYSGLGVALFLAGVVFVINFVRYKLQKHN